MVIVMNVLLLVLHVCMLRECEGDGNTGVESGRGVGVVSAHMGGTRGSGVVHSACDMLEISVVRGVGVMTCACVSIGAGWEVLVVRGLGLGLTNPRETWGIKWEMCLCFGCAGVGGIGEVGERLVPGSGRVGWCYVCVVCESGSLC